MVNEALASDGSLEWTLAGVSGDRFAAAVNPASPNIVHAVKNFPGAKDPSGRSARNMGPALEWIAHEHRLARLDLATPTTLYHFPSLDFALQPGAVFKVWTAETRGAPWFLPAAR